MLNGYSLRSLLRSQSHIVDMSCAHVTFRFAHTSYTIRKSLRFMPISFAGSSDCTAICDICVCVAACSSLCEVVFLLVGPCSRHGQPASRHRPMLTRPWQPERLWQPPDRHVSPRTRPYAGRHGGCHWPERLATFVAPIRSARSRLMRPLVGQCFLVVRRAMTRPWSAWTHRSTSLRAYTGTS